MCEAMEKVFTVLLVAILQSTIILAQLCAGEVEFYIRINVLYHSARVHVLLTAQIKLYLCIGSIYCRFTKSCNSLAMFLDYS